MGLLTRIEESRGSTLRNPAKWLREALSDGPASVSGVTVNHKNALGLTAFWNGVRIISQTVASLPSPVYERVGNGREIRRDHRVHRLLNVRPNPMMTPFTFKEIRAAHCLAWGNSFAEIEKDNAGRPIALWPLLPDRTGVEIKDGEKMYWTMVNGTKVWLSSDRVLHVPGLGFDGLQGYSVIKIHAESLGLSIAANQYGAAFFGNSGRPSGYIKAPGEPKVDERKELRESWNQVHSGLTKAQRTAVLWGGMEWKQISVNPEEAQFLQTRVTQIDEVARILNINPILLQQTQGVTTWGSAIGQFLVAYAKFTIAPWLDREEDAINYDLFSEQERDRLYVKYNADALMRGDPKQQAEILEIKRRNGIVNANEWRELDEENPIPGDSGDIYTIPVNYTDLENVSNIGLGSNGQDAAQTENNSRQPVKHDPHKGMETREQKAPGYGETRNAQVRLRIRNAAKAIIKDGAHRLTRREVQALDAALRKAEADGFPEAFLNDWIDEYYPKHREQIIRTMTPIIQSIAESAGAEAFEEAGFDPEDPAEFVEGFVEGMATREINSSVGQLRDIIESQETENVIPAISERAQEWSETRPEKVAMREAVAATAGVARWAWQKSGVTRMTWRANPGACPICQEMDGRTASVTGFFLADGDAVNPGEGVSPLVTQSNIASPPLHAGCECDIVPE